MLIVECINRGFIWKYGSCPIIALYTNNVTTFSQGFFEKNKYLIDELGTSLVGSL